MRVSTRFNRCPAAPIRFPCRRRVSRRPLSPTARWKQRNRRTSICNSKSARPASAVPQNFGSTNVSFAQQSLNFVQAGNTFQASGAFISGNRDSSSNISIDGSNVQIPVYGQATQLQSRAGVQEVRVESANMSPEFGNGVAAVNVCTKTGSNTYHAELCEYLRNHHLDANLFFNNAGGLKIQPYTQNQLGGAG